jgi:hypothetical protein
MVSFTYDARTPGYADVNACEREMILAAKRYDVPLAVLYAVGLTETSRRGSLQPFALNIAGVSLFPATLVEALQQFERARKRGERLIDVGCMQINHYFHGRHFRSVEAMFDPHENVNYAAHFLRVESARRQLDACRCALSRRARQRAETKALRLPRHRQYGSERIWRVDGKRPRFLRSARTVTRAGTRPDDNYQLLETREKYNLYVKIWLTINQKLLNLTSGG